MIGHTDPEGKIDWSNVVARQTGRIHIARNSTELREILPRVNPGDVVYLKNGVYNYSVDVLTSGKNDAPIVITRHPDNNDVMLTGDWRIKASHLIIGGFRGEWETNTWPGHFIFEGGSDNRLTDCDFGLGKYGEHLISIWKGSHRNLIDHCQLTGPGNRLVRVIVQWGGTLTGRGGTYDENPSDPTNPIGARPPTGNRVIANTLKGAKYIGKQKAGIACGQYIMHRWLNTEFEVKKNLFVGFDQIGLEFKTSKNSCLQNRFENFGSHKCALFRSGKNNLFQENVLKNIDQGIQVADRENIIRQNQFTTVTGDFAISMVHGEDLENRIPHNQFPWATKNRFIENRIMDVYRYGIEIGRSQVDDTGTSMSMPPMDNLFRKTFIRSDMGRAAVRQRAGQNRFEETIIEGEIPSGKLWDAGWNDAEEKKTESPRSEEKQKQESIRFLNAQVNDEFIIVDAEINGKRFKMKFSLEENE